MGGGHRLGATRENLFPNDRNICLVNIIWYKIGLERNRIQAGYDLLFHQLIFPMCGVGRFGIRGDPR